jgi:hypothetical protein
MNEISTTQINIKKTERMKLRHGVCNRVTMQKKPIMYILYISNIIFTPKPKISTSTQIYKTEAKSSIYKQLYLCMNNFSEPSAPQLLSSLVPLLGPDGGTGTPLGSMLRTNGLYLSVSFPFVIGISIVLATELIFSVECTSCFASLSNLALHGWVKRRKRASNMKANKHLLFIAIF